MIPYVRKMDFAYGRPDAVSPLIRRVIAENPGPFTFKGTGTYIVGHGEVAVIDPGPADDAHLEALLTAIQGETLRCILVTHDHGDHSPLAADLAERTGAPVYGATPGFDPVLRPGRDRTYRPDRVAAEGERFSGAGWTLEAVKTPGHTSNHTAYALLEENALFPGDHVMGWSTTVVVPPDGDMTAYCDSLRKIMALEFATLWPTHGPPITEPAPFLQAYLDHRLAREDQLRRLLAKGPQTIEQMLPALYVGLDARLRGAAMATTYAHLLHLVATGEVVAGGEATRDALYTRV